MKQTNIRQLKKKHVELSYESLMKTRAIHTVSVCFEFNMFPLHESEL